MTPLQIFVGVLLCIPGLVLYILLTLFAGQYSIGALDYNPFNDLRFEQSVWKEYESCVDGTNRRGPMSLDFRRRFLRVGMPQAEVVQQLDEGETVPMAEYREVLSSGPRIYFSDLSEERIAQSGTILRYYLGEELNMLWGVDRANFYLFFDQDHRYMGCRIAWY